MKGKKLVLKTLDDQGKPEEAAVAATRLIVNDKVTMLLGEVASSRSLAMAPVAEENKVPMISAVLDQPQGHARTAGQARPYVFRVCFIDPFQGTVMAKFARENLKVSKVAILRDVGNDYSVGLADYFLDKFKELGGDDRRPTRATRPATRTSRPSSPPSRARPTPRPSTCPATTPTWPSSRARPASWA